MGFRRALEIKTTSMCYVPVAACLLCCAQVALRALPPSHRSSSYVSSHVGTEICTRQLLGNNNCLTALMVPTSHPYHYITYHQIDTSITLID